MGNEFLIISAIPPSSGESRESKAAAVLGSRGIKCGLFAAVMPGEERVLDDYGHLEVFLEIHSNLRSALVRGKYSGAVFFDRELLKFYHREVKSFPGVSVVLIDPSNTGDEKADLSFPDVGKMADEMVSGCGLRKKLTSIVMLTFNQLDLTKECLASLERHTEMPYELIIVDNGSGDGTVEFIRKYEKRHPGKVRSIFNKENLAFSKANNQGIRISGGDYILLLNNDVVLTKGWLGKIIRCLESSENIGAVGPCTNVASGPQKVSPGYSKLTQLDPYAAAFALKYSGRWVNCHRLNAFCFLVKREVTESIGLLDERFGPGGFEDYDYCLRIRQAGYRIMLAGDTYVHHVGGQGYEPNRLNYNELRHINKRIFIDKWCRRALQIMENIPDG